MNTRELIYKMLINKTLTIDEIKSASSLNRNTINSAIAYLKEKNKVCAYGKVKNAHGQMVWQWGAIKDKCLLEKYWPCRNMKLN
jgi:hypothetical protein